MCARSRISNVSGTTAQSAAATNVSYDSLPSWGQNSTDATAIDPTSKADFPGLGATLVENADRRVCRRCKKIGHLARNCPSRAIASLEHQPAKSLTLQPPADNEEPPDDLLEFSDEDASLDQPTLKTLQEHRGELKELPERARQWTDLDLDDIQKKVNNVEDFQKRMTEPSLLDDECVPDAMQAERLADATVPVELKRKRKGKKGKIYYNLSPFVHY